MAADHGQLQWSVTGHGVLDRAAQPRNDHLHQGSVGAWLV